MHRMQLIQAHMGGKLPPAPELVAVPAAGGKVYRAAVVGLGFIGSGDDVSGAAIGQATIGEPVQTPFHSGGYASFPERINLVCGAPVVFVCVYGHRRRAVRQALVAPREQPQCRTPRALREAPPRCKGLL